MATISFPADPPTLPGPFNCLATVSIRDVVYLDGSDHVAKASGLTQATGPAVGVVVAKPTPTTCILSYEGEVDGFAGLTFGATYFLSTTLGGITTNPGPGMPTLPGEFVQHIGWARSATMLVLQIDRDMTVL